MQGVYRGGVIDAVDFSMESIVDQARMLFSSFSALYFDEAEEKPVVESDDKRYSNKIKSSFLKRFPDKQDNFTRKFPVSKGYNIAVQYAGRNLAANFCSMRSRYLKLDLDSSKTKLFDLLNLRDHQDDFGHQFESYELMALTRTLPKTGNLTKAQELAASNMEQLYGFADSHQLKVTALSSISEVVNRIAKIDRLVA